MWVSVIAAPGVLCMPPGLWPHGYLSSCGSQWVPKYNVEEDLSADMIAGITVGCMLIPQGICVVHV